MNKKIKVLSAVVIGLLFSVSFLFFYRNYYNTKPKASSNTWDFRFEGESNTTPNQGTYTLNFKLSPPTGTVSDSRKIRTLVAIFSYPDNIFKDIKESDITTIHPFEKLDLDSVKSGLIAGTNQIRIAVEAKVDTYGSLVLPQSPLIASIKFDKKENLGNGMQGQFRFISYELVDDISSSSFSVTKEDLTVTVGSGSGNTTPPAGTNTPTPTLTNTPPLGSTNTPIPTRTNTPPPGSTNTPIPTRTNTPPPANTNTPIPTGIGGEQEYFKIKLLTRFQGVQSKPKDEFNEFKVRVTLQNTKTNAVLFTQNDVKFVADANGVWSGEIQIPTFNDLDKTSQDVLRNSYYKLYIKGPKHIQKRICDIKPTETYPGTYSCLEGKIAISGDTKVIDTSGILLLAGDLPDQDGIVNAADAARIYNILNLPESERRSPENLRIADLNLDGVVNTIDYSLVQGALSIRSDDQ